MNKAKKQARLKKQAEVRRARREKDRKSSNREHRTGIMEPRVKRERHYRREFGGES